MNPQATFLNTPYGGYLHNEAPLEDDELTHVGPGTPCGEWLRRYWHPVYVADELKDLPVAIRILGEDLVIFRDRSGQIGLLELAAWTETVRDRSVITARHVELRIESKTMSIRLLGYLVNAEKLLTYTEHGKRLWNDLQMNLSKHH